MLPDFITALTQTTPELGMVESGDSIGPVFRMEEPVSIVSPVVFASPHSGRRYPDALLEGCSLGLLDLRRVEDAFVDRLISEVGQSGAPSIHALIGRALVDLNRQDDEIDREMFVDAPLGWCEERSPRVAGGLGCIPRIAHGGKAIYQRKLRVHEAETRISQIYRPYHDALAALVNRSKAMFGQAWLVDCHSMPSQSPGGEVDIVLGDRFGTSCDGGFTSFVEAQFRAMGYTTARNSPYAGGYSTINYGKPDEGVQALQIEIRRSLYINEHTLEPTQGLVRLREHFGRLATELRNHTRENVGLAAISDKKKAAS